MAAVEKISSNPPPLAVTDKINEFISETDYVVDYKVDSYGIKWREWKSGILEQWTGFVSSTSPSAGEKTVSFLRPFSNAEYNIQVTSAGGTSGTSAAQVTNCSDYGGAIGVKTATSIGVFGPHSKHIYAIGIKGD